MRFFIALIIGIIITSCCIFGTGETFYQIYVEHGFWGYTFTILIVIYVLISRNKNNYGNKKDTYSH